MKKIKELFSRYITSKYIAFLVTLINIDCFLIFCAKKYMGYLQSKNIVFSEIELFLYSVIVELLGIIIIMTIVYRDSKQKYNILKTYDDNNESNLDLLKQLKLLKKNIITKHKIFSFSFVTDLEKLSKKGDEIWIITGDLEEDSSNNDLIDIIGDNLCKGVKYRYFITKDHDGSISGKASNGQKALMQKYQAHANKRIFFRNIEYELVAPDIDIIIYNATDSKEKRRGFVCVEIGDKTETYAYQELNSDILEDLINQMLPYIEGVHSRKEETADKESEYKIFEKLGIVYDVIAGLIIPILSFSKIVSIKTAISSIVPAILIWLCLIFAQELIDTIINRFHKKLKAVVNDRESAYEILTNDSLKPEINNLIKKEEQRVFDQFSFKKAEKISLGKHSQTIWLLTDLSYDIASKEFSTWLMQKMGEFNDLVCNILYIDNLVSKGRATKIQTLLKNYGNRINVRKISSNNNRYIWSKTYGMVFVQSEDSIDSEIYISLGTAETALFKKVDTDEREKSNVLGILTSFYEEGENPYGSK